MKRLKPYNFQHAVRCVINRIGSEHKVVAALRDQFGVTVSQSAIHRLRDGTVLEPRHSIGEAIIALYRRVR